MKQVSFEWKASEQTPDLLAAIGLIVTTWARIDWSLNSALKLFWHDNKEPEELMPRSFDQRIEYLVNFVTPLYHAEPEELRVFRWFIARLKTANGNRDDVVHGIVGTITKKNEFGTRSYRGIMVPKSSQETRFTTFNAEQIRKLGFRLAELETEMSDVSLALGEVRNASLPNIRVWRDPGGWSVPTMESRAHKLPRKHTPPPTFRG